ncbi:MAG: cyclase family protein [Nitrospirae bacterium]|nr:cyclase family protein [Nitrospirota bacterium]
MRQYLSHQLSQTNPVYGCVSKDMEIKTIRSINNGDSCQVFWIGMESHWGTHIDCPAHFFTNANNVCDYSCNDWFFERPQVIKITAKPDQIITLQDINDQINMDTDIVLFVSGWEALRGQDVYSLNNPGLHPDIAVWLRRHHPTVRSVGIDWISISAFKHRETGRVAHKAFLQPYGAGSPILLIEDMKLSGNLSNLKTVFVAPIRIDSIDSAPCTVIGIFE